MFAELMGIRVPRFCAETGHPALGGSFAVSFQECTFDACIFGSPLVVITCMMHDRMVVILMLANFP